MRKISPLFVVILCLLSVAAVASAQSPATTETRALLYKISGNGLKKPSYLYGTIHIVCPVDLKGMDKLTALIGETEQTLLELDMDNEAEMKSIGAAAALAGGKTLDSFYTAEQYAKIDAFFKEYVGVSVDGVKMIKPSFLSIMVSTSPKFLGCGQPASYELSIVQAAGVAKKPVFGLETAAEQMAKLGSRSVEDEAKELYDMAANPQKALDDFKTMLEAYRTQDSDKLFKSIDGRLGSAAFQKALLDDRNIDWIPKIEKAVKEKPTFIAVGGGHLGGENGVIKLLRAKGYTLEPIRL